MEQLQQHYRQELLRAQLEIQEQTLKNISQEVHDNIGQVLSLARLNINAITFEEPQPLLQDKVKNISGLMSKAIQDLRDLSKSLHSDTITEKGLLGAIEYEFDMMKKAGAYNTSMIVEGEPYNFPD